MEAVSKRAQAGDAKGKPQRKCVVCEKFKTKAELLRLALLKTDRIVCDRSGCAGGKGIYICNEGACRQEFLKGKKYMKRFHLKMDALDLSSMERNQESFHGNAPMV